MRRDPDVALSKEVLARSGQCREDYRNCARGALCGTETAVLAEFFLQLGLFVLHDESPWRTNLNTSPAARAPRVINTRYHQSVIPTR